MSGVGNEYGGFVEGSLKSAPSAAGRPMLIFDGDCAFCTTCATWLAAKLHRADGVDAIVLPWQFADLAALGVSQQRAQYEVLWLTESTEVFGGAQAFARWLIHRGGILALAGWLLILPGIKQVAGAVYRVIARNRHRLPGGSPACALPPAQR